MIYFILISDILLSALLLWLIIRTWEPVPVPYTTDPELDRLLEVAPLDGYLDEHEQAITA